MSIYMVRIINLQLLDLWILMPFLIWGILTTKADKDSITMMIFNFPDFLPCKKQDLLSKKLLTRKSGRTNLILRQTPTENQSDSICIMQYFGW